MSGFCSAHKHHEPGCKQCEMETMETLKERIKKHESFRATPYRDAKGFSIGWGHYLGEGGAGFKISRNVGDKILDEDIHTATYEISTLGFEWLSKARMEVLVEMSYNLGFPRFQTFVKMLAALEAQDYEKAADEMLESKWHEQVKERAETLAEVMRTG